MKDCPQDYMDWLVTMYSLFGNKWAKLHRGPMWEGDIIEQRSMEDGTDLTSGTAHVGTNVHVHCRTLLNCVTSFVIFLLG